VTTRISNCSQEINRQGELINRAKHQRHPAFSAASSLHDMHRLMQDARLPLPSALATAGSIDRPPLVVAHL
jgi:hypothetical protein